MTEWHPEEQWILDAFDLDRNAERSFAFKDIVDWTPQALSSTASAKTDAKTWMSST